MAISDLTSPAAVKLAIDECNLVGREGLLRQYGFAGAREYVLRYQGKEYDSKAIAGVAHGLQNPRLGFLTPNEFTGGITSAAAGTRIFELGFEIQGKKRTPKDWSRTTSRPLHLVGPSGPNVLTITPPPGFTARAT